MIEVSVITCPHCEHRAAEQMPEDTCRIVSRAKGCGAALEPRRGDC